MSIKSCELWKSVICCCFIILFMTYVYSSDGFQFPSPSEDYHKGFKIVWNSPTHLCKSLGINFEVLLQKHNITVNEKDLFRGDKMVILYDPGSFPALIKNESDSKVYIRNGGVPQKGNITNHLEIVKQQVEKLIPDKNFNGTGVIDFESWLPVFRQNFGKFTNYQEYSCEIERSKNPTLSEDLRKSVASERFENNGRIFMEETIDFIRKLRPNARWGYYGFPHCFNMRHIDKNENCPDEIVDENNKLQWLWDKSDVLFPSVYLRKNNFNNQERLKMIRGRVREAMRISSRTSSNPEVYLYVWYKYQDKMDEFISHEDMENIIRHVKEAGLPGLIMWGHHEDVNHKKGCQDLKHYIVHTLGPLIERYKNRK